MGDQPEVVTLVFPLNTRHNMILLGKKRDKAGDPGSGRWNGAGGKVEFSEKIREVAVRELYEEFGLGAEADDLKPVAVIDFFFEEEHRFRCHVFLAEHWSFQRGDKCERCSYGKVEILQVHHKSRKREDNSMGNLELLCPNCHCEEHFLFGKKPI